MTCGEANDAVATFSGPLTRNFLVIHWRAPKVDSTKSYKFLFTVVQRETTFWVKNTALSDIKVIPGKDVKASVGENCYVLLKILHKHLVLMSLEGQTLS